ncbi:MAG: lysophospholipid acyltransferase family protein [Chloroflexota bacterium]
MATNASTEDKSKDPYFVPYPRRTLWRRIWRLMMRTLAMLFVNADVHGRRNFPREGPLIIVANHTAFLEIAMIVGYAPYQLEFLTTGDIPLEPRFAFWANLYGFIPVNRGSMDRKAMSKAVSVLEQDGVIVLFPQGGIWETKVTQARTGVAWLSQKGNAPVMPIGFGGTGGSFARAVRMQRPRITMNVGEVIPATPTKKEGLSRKETLEHSAGEIMQAVFDLIPQYEKDRWHSIQEEHYEMQIEFLNSNTVVDSLEDVPTLTEPVLVSMFFHRPVLLDAMRRNLELKVGALENLDENRDAAAFRAALDVVLQYVTDDNPFFLTYRFGNDEGKQMIDGLRSLREITAWAADQGYSVNIMPIRKYRMEGDAELTVLRYPEKAVEL